MSRGLLIVIEGADGVGKTEQQNRLIRRLQFAEYETFELDFPRYGAPHGALIDYILRSGVFTKEEVQSEWISGYMSAIYGQDRNEMRDTIWRMINIYGKIGVFNRFTLTNVAHQVPKVRSIDAEVARRLIEYAEFTHYELSRPDVNVLLNLSAEVSRQLTLKKHTLDAHEAIVSYQLQVREYFLKLARENPEHWAVIECDDGEGSILPPEEIEAKVWEIVEPRLPRR